MDTATARKRLETMLSDLDRTIGVLTGADAGARDRSAADAGADLTETERAKAMLDAARRQRRAIAEALERVHSGTYGRCVDCSKEVPEGRLEARPEAARCVSCQAKRERRR
ncbi:TraR/DksA family transcriptional regulator [Bailinhaonella thermotolerans]|uniref:Conjugal transfer protein TraR n=1 Tax=Bailinhaonella thermotolerans TaxID=1070861 RepID=A0A3A4AAF1_9ACTN|nr:TraR/DksA C4-type zinc finger protein [Bailinhaonella thermotolerans]RJL25191.1 conjugal transfer protein TraR [Bailinhaonella thermotolerans]